MIRPARSAVHTFEICLLAAAAFFVLQLPFDHTLSNAGAGILRFERASAGDAAAIVNQWQAHGAIPDARMQLLIDYFFIAAYVAAVVSLCRMAWIGLRTRFPQVRYVLGLLALAAMVAGACDAVENARLYQALGGDVVSAAAWARVKFWLIGVAVVGAVIAAAFALVLDRDLRTDWRQAHAGLTRWLKGVPDDPQPLVGRLPDAPAPASSTTTTTGAAPTEDRIAICCSGGGIRSASFNLGVLQVLMRRDKRIYQRAAVITAVSGGSYIASAVSVTRSTSEPGALTADRPAFAPGSPEELRLRTHMHYLVPDKRVAATAMLALMFGFITNLGVVIGACYVAARILGWFLHHWATPQNFTSATASIHIDTWVWVTCVALAGAGLAIYAVGDRFLTVYWRPAQAVVESIRTWATRLIGAAVLVAAVLIGLPAAVVGLNNLATHNNPSTQAAAVISAFGFTTDRGCIDAAQNSYVTNRAAAMAAAHLTTDPPAAVVYDYGACGQSFAARAALDDFTGVPTFGHLAGKFNEQGGGPVGSLVAVFVALLGLIKSTAGRVTPRTERPADASDATTTPSTPSPTRGKLSSLPRLLRQIVAPWIGTLLALAVIVIVTLRLAEDAMLRGISFPGLWHLSVVVAVLLLLPFVTDVNRTSLHPMYRERLATVFAVRRTADGRAEQVPYDKPLSFSKLEEPGVDDAARGGPNLVVCATANVEDLGLVAPGRGGAPFMFSRQYVGLSGAPGGSYQTATADYETAAGRRLLTLPAAVAISGAAVSPVMGRMTRRPVRFLLGIANVRLGVWLPNPKRAARLVADARPPGTGTAGTPGRLARGWQRALTQWRAPGVICLMRELVGRNSISRKHIYVTDGGHYDNLGLVEALRRQPTIVYVIDGSGDTPPYWSTLGHAISIARGELGVDIVLDDPLPVPDDGVVPTNVLLGTATYPDGSTARLVIGKLIRPAAETYDLSVFAHDDPAFPNKSTADQLYGDIEFESYRKLGNITGERMAPAAKVVALPNGAAVRNPVTEGATPPG